MAVSSLTCSGFQPTVWSGDSTQFIALTRVSGMYVMRGSPSPYRNLRSSTVRSGPNPRNASSAESESGKHYLGPTVSVSQAGSNGSKVAFATTLGLPLPSSHLTLSTTGKEAP